MKAGCEVNFHIVAHDPDAKVDRCHTFDFRNPDPYDGSGQAPAQVTATA